MAALPHNWTRVSRGVVLGSPAGLFLAVFYLLPLSYVIWLSFSEPTIGFGNYIEIFRSSYFLGVVLHTFKVAAIVTVSALVLGYPLAYVAANASFGLSTFLLGVVALSFWTSFLVRTYAWMVLLGVQGPVSGILLMMGWDPAPRLLFTTFSAVVGMTHALVPLMAMSIYPVMRQIDPRHTQAAATLGASPCRSFVHVYLPQTAPGIMTGCMLVFITCLGFYVMPVLLGSPSEKVLAGVVGDQIELLTDFGLASSMAIVLLFLTLILFGIYNHFFGLERLWRSS
ncbi:MAG: ABC transporter permease [Rhizobiaceae bacterium]